MEYEERIKDTMEKMEKHLSSHNSICVGVSGGSDSNIIVHMIATYFRDSLSKTHFIFEDTGLEYKATKKHLKEIEQKYNISIERVRGEPIPLVVKREGVPILSKQYSHIMRYALKGSGWALKVVNNQIEKPTRYKFSKKQLVLAKHILDNDIKISEKCCDLSKKKPYEQFLKKYKCDLTISGERQAEGGIRALSNTSCFTTKKNYDKYMPLFFWDDDTKDRYKKEEGIVYSDCYEVYGMKRTGCCCCPFSSRAGEELEIVKKYEPNLYKACMDLFGESYRLMDAFHVRRKLILPQEDDHG